MVNDVCEGPQLFRSLHYRAKMRQVDWLCYLEKDSGFKTAKPVYFPSSFLIYTTSTLFETGNTPVGTYFSIDGVHVYVSLLGPLLPELWIIQGDVISVL